MTANEQFFYDHAGWSHNPQTETPEQGRERGAVALAQAEAHAQAQEWWFDWHADFEPCIGCECGAKDCKCSTGEPHETLVCILWDREECPRTVLASLGSICEPSREYGRVVEAELALEAMSAQLAVAR